VTGMLAPSLMTSALSTVSPVLTGWSPFIRHVGIAGLVPIRRWTGLADGRIRTHVIRGIADLWNPVYTALIFGFAVGPIVSVLDAQVYTTGSYRTGRD
jgi:hypothetical protein